MHHQLRCRVLCIIIVVSGACPSPVTSAISGAIIIGPACTAPTFSTQPTPGQSECTGGTLTLGTVVADQSPTYQWYSNTSLSNTGGTSVGSGNGGSTDTYTPPSVSAGTYYYYCVATNGACNTASDAVQITVDATSIVSQSTAGASYSLNALAAALTVSASGAGLGYQWYSSTDNATNTTGDDIAVGSNSNSYTPLTTSLGTTYYYCIVTGTCSPTSVTSAVSGAINVVQYTTGDYMSRATGNWAINTTWNKWNGSAWVAAGSGDFPNTTNTTASVYISGGFTVTYNVTNEQVNNLYVLDGQLLQGVPSSTGSSDQRKYLKVFGTTIQVNTAGTLGSALTGDNADGLSLDLFNTGTVTLTGNGGLINISTIRYNNTTEVVIDHDVTLNYHGSANGGNAMSYCGNVAAPTNDNTLTINAGKTLTFAPLSCYSARTGSGTLSAVNLIINVNGTLTMQPYSAALAAPRGYLNTGAGAGKIFYLAVGSTGVVNLQEFLPNSTGAGTGSTGIVDIAAGGVMNVARETDLRDANTIAGDGAFNVLGGANVKIGDAAGITASGATGSVQTAVRSFSSAASYSYEGTTAQATGDGLPSSVNNFGINNSAGVSLTNAVTVNGTLALTSGLITTGANSITVSTTGASITGGSATSYVNGTLARAVASGSPATAVFPVGDATAYTPSTFSGNVTVPGTVTLTSTGADHPDLANYGLDPAKYIKRYWSVSNSLTAFSAGSLQLSYAAADLQGVAVSGNIKGARYNGAAWSYPATATASNQFTVSGLTESDINTASFTGGECLNPTAGITNNTGTAVLTCTVTSISVTATGGGTYSWDNGLGSGASKSITAPGTYIVTVTAASGCSSTASIVVTQDNTPPTAGITNNSGTTIVTCASPTISVTATGGGTYSWDNGLGNNANASITGAGTFTVTVTGANGCTSTASITTTNNSTNTFTGTGNWTDNARWSCGAPPSSGDNVTIAAGANATLNTNFIVSGSLTMTATSTLTVNPTRTLSVDVAATANFNGQSVTFKSDATGTASLGQVNGTLSGATNVTVERYIPNNGFRSWRLLSVPTFGSGQTIRQAWQEGTANPLPQQNNLPNYGTQITGLFSTQSAAAAAGFDSITINAGMLTWNGASWSNVTSTNVALANNKSYFLYIRGERSKSVSGAISNSSATTLRNTGTVYTGDQTTNVGAGAFALVPNLYPSAINFTGLTRTGGVNNLFYIWDSKKLSGTSLGFYQTFSGTNSFNCLISGGSYTLGLPNTTIESGQSFFVQTSTAGSLTLKESAKLSGTNGSLGFRPSANPSRIDSRLYNTNNEMLDANVVVFDAAYDRAVDADDAVKFGNPGANFAIETGSKILAIEGTQPPVNNDAIQFRMWNLQQQTYKFEFAVSNMNTQGLSAMLEDRYLNNTTAINLNGTTMVNFTIDATAASKDANRFRIVFKQSAPLPITFISIAANRTTEGIKVDWKVAAERNTLNYEVERSTDGRNFISVGSVTATGNNGADLSYNLLDAAAPQTAVFYRVKSAGTAGASRYSTIVKARAGNVKPGYAVLPNPVENGVVNLQFINQAAGKYAVRIMSTAGQSVMLTTINHAGGNSNQLLELPATMARGACQVEIIAPDKTRTVQQLFVNRK
ncbi:MAG: hypothetical protein IPP72_15395 [Chitinophagaceae bacterium]|nr:hypothetical protein [Chitinophagaceae bacterium]